MDSDRHRNDYSISKGLRSVVVSLEEQAIFDQHEHLGRVAVQRRLGLDYQRDKGMIHSWRYCDGRVRYTFQPEEDTSLEGQQRKIWMS